MNHAVDLVLRAVMAPVLAVQAVRVRRHALILPEAGGPRSGVVGVGQDLRLLIVGGGCRGCGAGLGVGGTRQPNSGRVFSGGLAVAGPNRRDNCGHVQAVAGLAGAKV